MTVKALQSDPIACGNPSIDGRTTYLFAGRGTGIDASIFRKALTTSSRFRQILSAVFIHELWLSRAVEQNHEAFALADKPAGFEVSRSTARKNQDVRVCPLHGGAARLLVDVLHLVPRKDLAAYTEIVGALNTLEQRLIDLAPPKS